MRRQRLSPVHLLLVVSLGPLMFSAHVTWTQEMSPASQTRARVSVLAPQSVVVPEAGIRFNPAYEKLSLPFAPNQGSSLGFHPFDLGYLFALTKNGLSKGPWQLTKMDGPQGKVNQFIGNTPTEWLTYSVPQSTVRYRTSDWGDALQYYGNRIPWAGRVMLGVGRQAAFHPRVVRVFEVIRPALSLGKPTYPRWLGR
jgi:hypothetical protein